MQRIELLDTTLRDGAQGEGVEHSLSDKRKIALALDRLGVPLIEGGNPTGNPKDQTFFEEARKAPFLTQAVLVPFGSTCHAGAAPEEDAGAGGAAWHGATRGESLRQGGYPAGDGGSARDAAGKPAHDP